MPQYNWDFPPEEIGENSGKTPEKLSELLLEFPSRVRLGTKPIIQGISSLQSILRVLSPQCGWGRRFFQKRLRRGLPERVMHVPAVLRVFLSCSPTQQSLVGTLSEQTWGHLKPAAFAAFGVRSFRVEKTSRKLACLVCLSAFPHFLCIGFADC